MKRQFISLRPAVAPSQKNPRRRPSDPVPAGGVRRRRNRVVIGAAAIALAVAGLAGWYFMRPTSEEVRPIILISIDTLRADHLPIHGYRGVRTPTIDQLAADGLVFDCAYAHSPQTSVSA
jgi:hypothetical protein